MSDERSLPLLVELLVEELPPKTLKRLGEAFSAGLTDSLRAQGLLEATAAAVPFATPRRLAVRIDAVRGRAADRAVSHKLMPASVGLDGSGAATPALLKRLAALGADAAAVPGLVRRVDGKSETLYLDGTATGATLAEGLQRALDETLARLPIAKVMQYQLADGWTSVSFVRPAHGLLALHGRDVVPVNALGLDAGRNTRGHRFMAAPGALAMADAGDYEQALHGAGVIASFEERRAEIVRRLQRSDGLVVADDPELLDEITGLVEWPNVVECRFDAEFLAVPAECLVLTMKVNQRYFPLQDGAGTLTDRFLVVSNIEAADMSSVIAGNERVVRPRLADAKFFFDQDRRKSLASRVPALDQVVYHGKLGSQGERVGRVRALARWVAERIGADPDLAGRAALLAKADLLTDMVGEFPELQGVMGGYYAAHDGEAADVVEAIRNQYVNRRGAGDEAVNLVREALVIADRVETLVGIWGIGLKPTGDKDPYALRRHALTLIDSLERVAAPALELGALLDAANDTFATPFPRDVLNDVVAFVFERNLNRLSVRYDPRAVEAVIALRPRLDQVVHRIEAVRDFQALAEAPALAAAYKRVTNILRKSSEAASPGVVTDALLVEPAERSLASALADAGGRADAAYDAGRYAESLQRLAALKLPVDAFFDSVMVNAEDPALRANRLALLASLRSTMNRVADLSLLAA